MGHCEAFQHIETDGVRVLVRPPSGQVGQSLIVCAKLTVPSRVDLHALVGLPSSQTFGHKTSCSFDLTT